MNFDLTDVQSAWREKGASLGRDVAADAAAAGVIMGAGRAGLLDPGAELLAMALAVDAMAIESPAAAVIFALHTGTALAVAGDEQFTSFFRGEAVAAVGLSSDDMPVEEGGRLSGRAPWVAPITDRGVAIVAPRSGGERTAYAVPLDDAWCGGRDRAHGRARRTGLRPRHARTVWPARRSAQRCRS